MSRPRRRGSIGRKCRSSWLSSLTFAKNVVTKLAATVDHPRRTNTISGEAVGKMCQGRLVGDRNGRGFAWPKDDRFGVIRELVKSIEKRVASAAAKHDALLIVSVIRIYVGTTSVRIIDLEEPWTAISAGIAQTKRFLQDSPLKSRGFAIAIALKKNLEAHI